MDQINAFITKHQSKITSETELELRIGSFNGKYFNSSITIEEFLRIKSLLTNPTIINSNDTSFYKFPYRQRKIRDNSKSPSVWIKKEKIDVLDIPELNIRIAFAIEKTNTFKNLIHKFNIHNPNGFFAPKNVTLLRKKTRYSEVLTSWRVDLTKIENFKYIDKKWILIDVIYEFELELINNDNPIQNLLPLSSLFFTPNYYYLLTKTNKFIGNQPKTLERKDMIKLTNSPYSLTDKVDGTRMMLLIYDNHALLIDKKFQTIYLDDGSGVFPFIEDITSLNGTLIDGEYLSKTKQFLAFDILYYQNENIMSKNLNERHEMLDIVLKNIHSPKIIAKTFYYSIKPEKNISFVIYSKNIFIESKRLWESENKERELDGLIYTPILESYTYKTNTYKWKDEITIDVTVKNNEFYANERGKLVKLNDRLISDTKFHYNGTKKIKNNSIVEFMYKNNSWEILRIRKDKKYPNAILTIKSALLAIKECISIHDVTEINPENTGMQYNVTGKSMKKRNKDVDIGYRRFHNQIKNYLIDYKSNENSFLLDLGAGKGGDMIKWNQAGYTHVLAIDSSWQHIYGENGFIERYNKMKDKINVKITIIWGDVTKNIRSGEAGLNNEESTKLKAFFKTHKALKFDKITCNFAIHYFMKSQELWNQYTRNVKLLLKKNGLFVGTYLNGHKVQMKDFFHNQQLIYSIKFDKELNYNSEENFWDNVPEISIKTLQWDHYIQEPVIFPELLEKLMKKIKFKKEEVHESFEDYTSLLNNPLTPDEKVISFMHNIFIYKK